MFRWVSILVYLTFLASLCGQDTMILKTNEAIPCDIKWETPLKYKARIQSKQFEAIYGKDLVIKRSEVRAIRDHNSHRKMKGFGKVTIIILDGSIKRRVDLYSTTSNSIIYTIANYSNQKGERVYLTNVVPVEKIKTIRWYKNNVGAGAAVGGIIGFSIGMYAGKEISSYLDGESAPYVTMSLLCTAAGAGIGTLIGAATLKKLEINGDPAIWERERHKFPPFDDN